MNSDDGSILWIDGNKVIDNDGVHAPVVKTAEIYLTAGVHDFVGGVLPGGRRVLIALQVWWTPPGESEQIIPKDRFLLPTNPGRRCRQYFGVQLFRSRGGNLQLPRLRHQ